MIQIAYLADTPESRILSVTEHVLVGMVAVIGVPAALVFLSADFVLCAYSVLPPPPPRYTVPVAYAAGASNGMAVPIVETNNIITHPEKGCPLQVGEGTFVFATITDSISQ